MPEGLSGRLAVWLQACRYRSLAISSMAVVAGAAAAWYEGFTSPAVLLAWVGAVAAQAGTNLTNVAWNYKAARNPDPRGSSAVMAQRILTGPFTPRRYSAPAATPPR